MKLNTRKHSVLLSVFVMFVIPVSTGYKLRSYEFGSGGRVGVSSNYAVEGTAGQVAGKTAGTTYNANAGLVFVQQANTPDAPTFQNNDNWYNKLFFIINTSANPTDTTYAIAISDDGWVTTKYVQTDNTISTSYGSSNFQTYSAWGGASGAYIIGLTANTTYQLKVKARQGVYTEGPFGPAASAATTSISLTTDIDISPTDLETAAPYTVSIGTLTGGTVVTANDKIWIDLDTNASHGAQVFINDAYGGLKSNTTSITITSATANLTAVTTGFGLQGSTATQSSGGPLNIESPYNGSSNNVGLVTTTIRPILSSDNPIVAGRASIILKAKVSDTTPAATDYADLFTVIAAGSF